MNRITIRGAEQLPPWEERTTRAAAALAPGTNLLRAPVGQIETALKALPWVESAHVAWQAPHALNIRFTPRRPAVVVQTGERKYEVDDAGIPIRIAGAEAAKQLPRLELDKGLEVRLGTPLHDESLLAAIKIYREAPSQPMVRIGKIIIDSAGNMCLNMMDGIQVQLGQPEDLPVKLKYLRRVYQLDSNVASRLAAINLSVPKQPACTLKGDVPIAAAAPSVTASPDNRSPDDNALAAPGRLRNSRRLGESAD